MSTADGATVAEASDPFGARPRLDESHVDLLREYGESRKLDEGTVLQSAGDIPNDLVVVESGQVCTVDGGGEVVDRYGPGRFLGGVELLTGRPAPLTALAAEAGEMLMVAPDRLRLAVQADPSLGNVILRAFLQRLSIHTGLGGGLRIFGSRFAADTRRLRDFAARNRLPYRWIDLEEDTDADDVLRGLGIAPPETPVAIWGGEKVLRNPSNAELARAIGGGPPSFRDTACDVAVVGAGPAGLATALYAASEGLAAVLLDATGTGGQAPSSARIGDYLGFPAGVSGAELVQRARLQAVAFGATIGPPSPVVALEGWEGRYALRLSDGPPVRARTVVIATGARYRHLTVAGLDRFAGTCVYHAATATEAQLCRDTPVVIVGGGNAAGQAAVFLSEHAERVHLVIRGARPHMSRYLADRIDRTARIDLLPHTEVRTLNGEDWLRSVTVVDNRTGAERELPASALFVFIGAEPNTGWLDGNLALDRNGFILTGTDVRRPAPPTDEPGRPFLLESSLPAVFAAGDVRAGSVKRIAAAVGEGAMAVRYIHELRGA